MSDQKVKIIKRADIEKERETLERVEIAYMYLLMDRYRMKAAEYLARKVIDKMPDN